MIPKVYGLVLAGGKSSRMGRDKGAIDYHGKSQREYCYELLSMVCDAVFISCRKEQSENIEPQLNKLLDRVENLGPTGGILTAFEYEPAAAWLVVACDLPYLNEQALRVLLDARDAEKVATAYKNPDDNDFPEPLIAIWEPKSRVLLEAAVAQGKNCPRKVLINADCKLIAPPTPDVIANINTPDEYQRVVSTWSKS